MELILLISALMNDDLSAYFQEVMVNHPPMTLFSQGKSNINIKVKEVALLAREEINPPVGQSSTPNRDIGFATVFLSLENQQKADSKIKILSISIINTDNKIQNFDFPTKEIILRPLENSEQAFYMTNKTGYSDSDKVKALVTYQIGEQLSTVVSDFVQVNRR